MANGSTVKLDRHHFSKRVVHRKLCTSAYKKASVDLDEGTLRLRDELLKPLGLSLPATDAFVA